MAKSTWDPKLAQIYRRMLPPGPPSESELAVYEKFVKALKNKKGAKVLILGSTPGLRSLCLKHRVPYVSVDYHRENFAIMRQIIKYKDTGEVMVGNWCQMKLPEKYDLVMGDISFGMVPFSALDKILVRVAGSLKKDAVVVHRTWMRQKGHFKDFEKFLHDVHPKLKKQVPPFTSLALPFVMFFYDQKRERILFAQNLPKLKNFVRRGLLPKNDYQQVELFWSRYKMPNYYPLKEKYEKKIKKYFRIRQVLYGKDWFRQYAPIYILKKK